MKFKQTRQFIRFGWRNTSELINKTNRWWLLKSLLIKNDLFRCGSLLGLYNMLYIQMVHATHAEIFCHYSVQRPEIIMQPLKNYTQDNPIQENLIDKYRWLNLNFLWCIFKWCMAFVLKYCVTIHAEILCHYSLQIHEMITKQSKNFVFTGYYWKYLTDKCCSLNSKFLWCIFKWCMTFMVKSCVITFYRNMNWLPNDWRTTCTQDSKILETSYRQMLFNKSKFERCIFKWCIWHSWWNLVSLHHREMKRLYNDSRTIQRTEWHWEHLTIIYNSIYFIKKCVYDSLQTHGIVQKHPCQIYFK